MASFLLSLKQTNAKMKKAIFLSVLFLIALSCNTSKKAVAQDGKTSKAQILTACPENVDCTLEVFQNKSMVVKTDGIGGVYYELEDDAEKTVYLYTYKLKTDKQYQDAGYREEIIFETDSATADFALTDKDLQNTKILFGVWCYCKGKAGNYKVTKGNFSKKGKEVSINFPAIVDDQKVTALKIKI